MTTPTPEVVCPDCGYSVLAHTEGVPTWPSGMYLLWERVCTLTPGQALAKWIAQDRAETRRAVFGEIACSVCWSVSWAPCGADEPGAVKDPQDPSGEKYMFCQLCAAEQRLRTVEKETRRAALLEVTASAAIVPADVYAVIARLLLGTSAQAKTPDPIGLLVRVTANSRDASEGDCLYCDCEQGSGPDGNDCYADCPLEMARALIDAAQEQERAQGEGGGDANHG